MGLWLAGCGDRSEIESGSYEARELVGHDEDRTQILATTLDIDRDAGTATFTLDDGSQIVSAWTERKHSDWPSGCPTNYTNTDMEILVLDEAPLSILSLELSKPALIADCPGDSTDVVLTEDAPAMLSGGGACNLDDDAPCLRFAKN